MTSDKKQKNKAGDAGSVGVVEMTEEDLKLIQSFLKKK